MAVRVFIGETKDVALVFDSQPPDDIVAAMRAERLPDHVRWMTGSLIHRMEDGERVGHGILTRDPMPGSNERRPHVAVICRSIDEAAAAVADAADQVERESAQEY